MYVRYSCGFLCCLKTSGHMRAFYRRLNTAVPNKIRTRVSKELKQRDDPTFIFFVRYQTSNYTKFLMYGMTGMYPRSSVTFQDAGFSHREPHLQIFYLAVIHQDGSQKVLHSEFELQCQNRAFAHVSAGFYSNRAFTISIQISPPTNRFCTLKLIWLLCFTKKYSMFWVQMKTDYFTSSPIQGIANVENVWNLCWKWQHMFCDWIFKSLFLILNNWYLV